MEQERWTQQVRRGPQGRRPLIQTVGAEVEEDLCCAEMAEPAFNRAPRRGPGALFALGQRLVGSIGEVQSVADLQQ